SEFTAGGQPLSDLTPEQRRTTTPRPWLALVLIAEGEGSLLSDVPVADCTTSGTALADPSDVDVPKATSLEIPESVVTKVFPALEALRSLVHVREVDLNDTELALGDDDGWMAVVLCNRLPQANTSYSACLINVEGQYGELPPNPPVAAEYDPSINVVDIGLLEVAVREYAVSADAVVMGTTAPHALAPDALLGAAPADPGHALAGPEAGADAGANGSRTSKAAASPGAGGSASDASRSAPAAPPTDSTTNAATAELSA